ncbi:MAG TPA: ATP-dependent DNA helicase RecG [Candidatus Limisoma intestinavium]|uniref:ATP-dependent DNA helicase RecG n=1 Tax=Candidatus Limisoma intestinavium TaxID=2840856 RepID=A0A9D1ILE5_9BACT|nr:ATP-dependent DNA helicase RecG [Candidatus Limisoma intestinavium]
MFDPADTDIKYLAGVGPKRAELLNKQLGIRSCRDLLYYFPFRYVDRSRIYTIAELTSDMPDIQIKGHFVSFTIHGEGAKRRLQGLFSDGTGIIDVVWFNRVKSISESYHTGIEYILFGKPSIFNGHPNLVHPEIEPAVEESRPRGLQGVYNLTDTLRNRSFTSKTIRTLVHNLFDKIKSLPETLPQSVREKYRLIGLYDALSNIHMPTSLDMLQKAKLRLKFEELFLIQLNILKYAKTRKAEVRGFMFPRIGSHFNRFYSEVLPFSLTEAQKQVIREIRDDMRTGRQMNRLLQGDVGSGKTIVALMSALIAADNGFQTCIMAPTEILATQHYESLSAMCNKIGVKIELLTGSTKKSKREEIANGLLDGSIHILVGTHAVIEDNVNFRRLGLVVIDEQHRFGVAQRAKLWSKNVNPPHVLVMTATPIPRTLAMTVYGDLDVSAITQLPPGRKPVATLLKYENSRTSVNQIIRKELQSGRQVYIVYPLIQENEKLDLKNVEDGFQYARETFSDFNVGLVHGKMKPADKDRQMQLFATGKTQILVATTVIEVGVNVPNASVMIIENAERFGLSQLHQLRGRVGRGADQSYCILMTKPDISKDTRRRLEIMTETSDGFQIAEADMQLRGPGDIEGTQQSGIAFNLRIANLAADGQIVRIARECADAILNADPALEHPDNRLLAEQLRRHFGKTIDWSRIS